MRVYNLGAYVRVCVSAYEVDGFRASWPCSGLPRRAIAFEFDARNGDLVDITPSDVDGPAALALSHDASNYAAKRLRNPVLAR